jgi:5-hydroxyisourate hydrolase
MHLYVFIIFFVDKDTLRNPLQHLEKFLEEVSVFFIWLSRQGNQDPVVVPGDRGHREKGVFHMTETSGLSVHVLDSVCGTAAQGIRVSLYYKENTVDEKYILMVEDETNADGRVEQLAPDGSLAPGKCVHSSLYCCWHTHHDSPWFYLGTYKIRFHCLEYFSKQSMTCFYPFCDIVFSVGSYFSHFHIPLILSPFGYTTYKGV